MLSESAPQEFVDAHGFRMLADDNMAVNPAIAFRVETFEPTDGFTPTKSYATRLKWRDGDNEHSKLLLTKPRWSSPWSCGAKRNPILAAKALSDRRGLAPGVAHASLSSFATSS